MLFKRKWLFLILVLSFLTACTGTIQEEADKAKEQAMEAFEAKAKNANVEKETLSLYLPVGFEVDETDPNNVLLTRDDKLYLLFINPNEEEKSHVVYDATTGTETDFLLNETFESDDRFGYIVLKEVDEDVYELVVGIGGMKLTTETNKKDLADDAGMMMEIVSSVQLKNG